LLIVEFDCRETDRAKGVGTLGREKSFPDWVIKWSGFYLKSKLPKQEQVCENQSGDSEIAVSTANRIGWGLG